MNFSTSSAVGKLSYSFNHWFYFFLEVFFIIHFVFSIEDGFILNSSNPIAKNTGTSFSSEAASPHMLTFIPSLCPLSMVIFISFNTAGSYWLYKWDMASFSLSTARVYWIKSFVPILKSQLPLQMLVNEWLPPEFQPSFLFEYFH